MPVRKSRWIGKNRPNGRFLHVLYLFYKPNSVLLLREATTIYLGMLLPTPSRGAPIARHGLAQK